MNKTYLLQELKKESEGCKRCGLHVNIPPVDGWEKGRTPSVFGSGRTTASIVIVGQNPGLNEVTISKPFVGRAGAKLDEIMSKVGLSRNEVYITNSTLCYTTMNVKPAHECATECAKYFLKRQLEIINPTVVITLGAVAFEAMNVEGDYSVRRCASNFSSRSELFDRVIPSLHPAFLLYRPNPDHEKIMQDNFLLAMDIIKPQESN